MKRKTLTTAALLAAATALPTLAEDQAAPVHVEHDVVFVQNDGGDVQAHEVIVVRRAEGDEVAGDVTVDVQVVQQGGVDGADGPEVRARVVMMDEDGNVIELDGDQALQWVEGENLHVAPGDMGVPGVTLVEGEDGELRVFLRQIGQPDVVGQAPVNPPMVEATYLGLNCEPLDFDTAALLLVDEGTGLAVTYVAEDSPAAAAGLQVGDTLLQLDDQTLINPEQLAVLIRTQEAGETVTLTVVRDGEEFEIEAELGTNTVPQLGPGGRNLSQFWNVERQGNAGEMFFLPELEGQWAGNLALVDPDMKGIQAHLEMLEAMLAEHGQHMPDIAEIRGNAEAMRAEMLLHQEELMELMAELNGVERDFDQQHEFEFDRNAAMNLVWNDGEHTLTVNGDGEGGQTLNVTDADGKEIYDGPLPEGDALDELPEDVRPKVEELLGMANGTIEFGFEPAPEAPDAPEAPEAP